MAGYIGSTPVPQGIQEQQSFTATAGQTTFNTLGYTDGNTIRVTLNGVLLEGSGVDYTAINGSDIVLTTAASADDILTFETFNEFTLVGQALTTPTISGGTLKSNVTLKNDTEQDTDGGRASKIIYQGEQSGGEISTLAEIEASHDGTADDEKGDLIFRTNDGNDSTSPTERLRINSAGDMLFSSDDPSLTIANTTHEDTDGGRESTIVFQGEQSGGEVSTLAQIEAAHDGTADDEKGKLIFRVNDGNDGASPTLSTEITSDGGVHIKPDGLQAPLIVENQASNSLGSYIKIRDGNSTAGQHTWLGRSTHDTYLYANNTELAMKVTGGSSGAGFVTLPHHPAFNTAGYKDHTITGTGSVVMSSGNVWSQYVSHGYASTNSGWDVGTGTYTAPVAGRYCFTLAYQLSSHNSGYFYTYLQHNGVTKTYQYSPQTTNQIPIAQNAIFNMAANDTARVVYLTNYVSGIISLVSFSGHLIG